MEWLLCARNFNHWPRCVPHTLTVPANFAVGQLGELSARRYPDKAALLFFGNVTSYRELAQGAERLAAHWHASGVRRATG